MTKKTFPLGFWNYATMEQIGAHPVKDWVECGMNLCLSPRLRPGRDDVKEIVALLDECLEKGVQLIIDDPRCCWTGASTDPEAYRKNFVEMLDQFGRHPAVWGYYVGDEPRADQMADAIAAIQIQTEIIPEKTPFINLNPYWDGNEVVLDGMDFDDWIDDFVRRTGLRQLSYDHYAQMNPPDAIDSGVHEYFKNLNYYMAAAKRNGIPLWVTNLTTGHFRYRCPSEDDLRWQLNTTVASGAKCVWWFFFYLRLRRINYRNAPLNEHAERTDTYTWLSELQRSFQHQYGTLFAQLEHDETYHCGRTYGGYPLLEYKRHPLIWRVTCDQNLPAIVSFFHMEDGTKYMALVNNSLTDCGYFHCYFSPKVKGLHRVAHTLQEPPCSASGNTTGVPAFVETHWGGVEVNCARDDVYNCYEVKENGVVHNGGYLAPGQMEVYRIVL